MKNDNYDFVLSDCLIPPTPTNGRVSYTEKDSEVSYTCRRGYSLVGLSTRHCSDNGTWSGDTPYCSESIEHFSYSYSLPKNESYCF